MSEVDLGDQSPGENEEPAKAAPPTAGQMLRAAREAAGLHIAALAVSMKVPVKKLEALEADRADLLLDAVFARALASSVCRALKIDAAPVLELLPQTTKPKFESGDRGINAPFKVPGQTSHMGLTEVAKRPAVVAVVLLLLAAIAIVLVPEIQWPAVDTKSEAAVATEVPAKEQQLEPAFVEKVEDKPLPVEVVPGPGLAESGKSPVAEPSATPVAAALAAVSAPVAASVTATAIPAKSSEMVVIRAKGTTWVEVLDASGAVLVRRTLQADGVTSATGVAPLSVVVGKADMVEIDVRGKPFSMQGIAKDNVARFEVK